MRTLRYPETEHAFFNLANHSWNAEQGAKILTSNSQHSERWFNRVSGLGK